MLHHAYLGLAGDDLVGLDVNLTGDIGFTCRFGSEWEREEGRMGEMIT
jgi:hypothetical protein